MNKSIFDQYMNNNKQLVMMKARRTGMSSSLLMNWKKIYNIRIRLNKDTALVYRRYL